MRFISPLIRLVAAVAAFGTLPTAASASTLPPDFTDVLVADTLRFPVGMAFLPDGRLLVTESKNARLLVIANGMVADIGGPDSVDAGTEEEGLLGVVADPGWPLRPYVYLFYTAVDDHVWIVRYNVTGDLSDGSSTSLTLVPGSRYTILRDIPDIRPNHNGGTLRFGPDGMLWSAFADDADGCSAQDTLSLHGVIVRMDVSGLPDGGGGPANKASLAPPDNPLAGHANLNARLVWAIGLRNPFRFHIDPVTGTLYLGDVGHLQREEIDECDGPGMNFGWPFYEGTATKELVDCGPPTPGLTDPIAEYDNPPALLASVIAGPVYRSSGGPCAFPSEYEGNLFFSDFYDGALRRLEKTGSVWALADSVAGQPSAGDWGRGLAGIADYAIGPDGALWYVRFADNFQMKTGQVRRICYTSPVGDVAERDADEIALGAPWPSPARGAVNLSYTLPRPGRVSLSIHDVAGRVVRRLLSDQAEPAGRGVVTWDGGTTTGGRAPAGLYVVRLFVDGAAVERRIALLR